MAERTGTYTAFDYADIMEHLIGRWEVPKRHVSKRCFPPPNPARAMPCATIRPLNGGPRGAAVLLLCPQFQSGEAAKAQEYLVDLPARIRKLAERAQGASRGP